MCYHGDIHEDSQVWAAHELFAYALQYMSCLSKGQRNELAKLLLKHDCPDPACDLENNIAYRIGKDLRTNCCRKKKKKG